MTGASCDFQDFVQLGNMGLLKAIEKYDIDNKWGASFNTFAYVWIRSEIYNHMR